MQRLSLRKSCVGFPFLILLKERYLTRAHNLKTNYFDLFEGLSGGNIIAHLHTGLEEAEQYR